MPKASLDTSLNTRNLANSGMASRVAAAVAGLFLAIFMSGAHAADGKGNTTQEARQAGVQIESVIGNSGSDRAPTLELLQEGFVIECSARFESGCKLFLRDN